MSGVYSISTTVKITFLLQKLYLKKLTKKQLNFQTPSFALGEKLSNFSSYFFFTHHFQKSVLLSIIKVPYKSVLLPIITCRNLKLTYNTHPKVLYKSALLSSKNVALRA